MFDKIDQLGVNTIRTLSIEAVQKANSGHPGLPMGAAPMAYALWTKHLKVNPTTSKNWADRDRFILSAGHGSAMLYSLLHLAGYQVTIDDLKQFRQWDSKTPGHPEVHHTDGVEATTGPLGQGIAMAVGMAMAEAHLAAVFNKENYPVVDHYTYVLGGDGCMMEGISSEAFSLAGTLGLGKLIVLYDSNRISIEGSTDIAFTENVQKRMEAFGFQLITVEDGNDLDAIGAAIEEAKADTTRPSFITVKTQIGYGCPTKQGSASAHGEPLGEENVAAMKILRLRNDRTMTDIHIRAKSTETFQMLIDRSAADIASARKRNFRMLVLAKQSTKKIIRSTDLLDIFIINTEIADGRTVDLYSRFIDTLNLSTNLCNSLKQNIDVPHIWQILN